MTNYQLGVIGAGNMAEALLRGALAAKVLDARFVLVSDVSPARRDLFTREFKVAAVDDNAAAAACPRLLLAVKPQIMPAVLETVARVINAETLVISIAAGIRTAQIAAQLAGRGRIVRVMPNTPLMAGMGATALAGGAGATPEDLDWTGRLFASCGIAVVVSEREMDAVTAVSGSGPAYFFYLLEAMTAAGQAEGLDEATALQLAIQTCRGAGELLFRTGQKPQAARAKVTSPNGTTQAAIEALDKAGVKDALVAAIRRAAERSRELGS
jgi:pyrroline-5-carboxylate reductase